MKEHIDILTKRREEREKNEVHGSPTTIRHYIHASYHQKDHGKTLPTTLFGYRKTTHTSPKKHEYFPLVDASIALSYHFCF
jgi:hypothetical protein